MGGYIHQETLLGRPDLLPFTTAYSIYVTEFVSAWLRSSVANRAAEREMEAQMMREREGYESEEDKEIEAAEGLLRLRTKKLDQAAGIDLEVVRLLEKSRQNVRRRQSQLRAAVERHKKVWLRYHAVAGLRDDINNNDI